MIFVLIKMAKVIDLLVQKLVKLKKKNILVKKDIYKSSSKIKVPQLGSIRLG
jgi:hypothetical protein